MKLINGNCINVMQKLIDDNIKVDLVVTSPPYDNLRNYKFSLEWNFDIFKQVANKLWDILKEGGVIVWIVNDSTIKGSKSGTSFNQALYFKQIGFNLHDVMIFAKNNPLPQIFHKRYTDSFEYMFILSKGAPKTCNPLKDPCKHKGVTPKSFKKITQGERERITKTSPVKDYKIKSNIWFYNTSDVSFKKYKHPAMFPLQLAKDHILTWSNPKDMVLDCFMGSGTTGAACLETDRDFIGIEINKEYYDIATSRLSENEKQSNLREFL